MSTPTASVGPGSLLYLASGERLVLGALIKSGGAGGVYLLDSHPTSVAKIYHPSPDLAHYERKLHAMLRLMPELPALVEGGQTLVQMAWPTALVFDTARRFCGFLMPKLDIEATIELEYMLQERQARSVGLPTGLGARATLAANLSAVVAELHRQQHYVVDMKPVNLRFYKRSLHLALIDCDGFSVQGEQERHHAPQFTPDYLAPEFHHQGIDPSGEAQQDRFALAVIVFQLLNFGLHPYSGRPKNEQVPTDIPGRIARHCYPYGRQAHPHIEPSPVSGHAHMPLALRHLFDRAFAGHEQARPTAAEWAHGLTPFAQRASGQLVVCASNPEHQHFAGQACAACARLGLRQSALHQQPSGAARAAQPPAPPTQPQRTAAPPTKRQRRQQQAQAQAQATTPTAGVPTQRQAIPPPPRGQYQQAQATPPAPQLPNKSVNTFVWGIELVWLVLAVLALVRCTVGGDTPKRKATAAPPPIEAPAPTPTPRPEATPRSVNLDSLLHAAAQGNAAQTREHMQRLSTYAEHKPRLSNSQRAIANAAERDYYAKLSKLSGPERMAQFNQALDTLYAANPQNPSVAAEYGLMHLMSAGRVTNLPENAQGPTPALEAERKNTQAAYRHALVAQPHVAGYWYGLALSCVDEDNTDCAVGAFALAHLQQSKDGTAGFGNAQHAEFFFIKHRKERLNVLRARGQVAAESLGGPGASEEVRMLAQQALLPSIAPAAPSPPESKKPKSKKKPAKTQPSLNAESARHAAPQRNIFPSLRTATMST